MKYVFLNCETCNADFEAIKDGNKYYEHDYHKERGKEIDTCEYCLKPLCSISCTYFNGAKYCCEKHYYSNGLSCPVCFDFHELHYATFFIYCPRKNNECVYFRIADQHDFTYGETLFIPEANYGHLKRTTNRVIQAEFCKYCSAHRVRAYYPNFDKITND